MNAPRTCPNSSLSRKLSVSAPQFKAYWNGKFFPRLSELPTVRQHLFRANCGMHLPGNLEQCLQADYLLLQVNDFGVGVMERRGRHRLAAAFLRILC